MFLLERYIYIYITAGTPFDILYGLKYVLPETEFEPFKFEFEWLNLNNWIEKLNLNHII